MHKPASIQMAAILFLSAIAGSVAGGEDIFVVNPPSAITYPDAWTVDRYPEYRQSTTLVKGIKENSSVSVDVYFIPNDLPRDVRPFVDHQIIDNGARFSNYKLIEKAALKIGELEAFRVTFEFSDADGRIQYKRVAYFLRSGDKGYQITTQAPKDEFYKYAKDMDGIVKSFKLADEK